MAPHEPGRKEQPELTYVEALPDATTLKYPMELAV